METLGGAAALCRPQIRLYGSGLVAAVSFRMDEQGHLVLSPGGCRRLELTSLPEAGAVMLCLTCFSLWFGSVLGPLLFFLVFSFKPQPESRNSRQNHSWRPPRELSQIKNKKIKKLSVTEFKRRGLNSKENADPSLVSLRFFLGF